MLADFYRYFDATPQAEFLYACVKKTALEDLPRETDYLRRYDAFKAHVAAIVEMPDRTVDLLFRMLHQNRGRLSKRARDKEFARLTPWDSNKIEEAYAEAFAAECPPFTGTLTHTGRRLTAKAYLKLPSTAPFVRLRDVSPKLSGRQLSGRAN